MCRVESDNGSNAHSKHSQVAEGLRTASTSEKVSAAARPIVYGGVNGSVSGGDAGCDSSITRLSTTSGVVSHRGLDWAAFGSHSWPASGVARFKGRAGHTERPQSMEVVDRLVYPALCVFVFVRHKA